MQRAPKKPCANCGDAKAHHAMYKRPTYPVERVRTRCRDCDCPRYKEAS